MANALDCCESTTSSGVAFERLQPVHETDLTFQFPRRDRSMKFTLAAFFLLALFSNGSAQKAEVTISLNEAFFDAALDALFVSGVPLEFPIAENGAGRRSMEFPKVTFANA